MKNTLILISSLLIISTFSGCSSKQKNSEQQSVKKQLIGMEKTVTVVYKNVSMAEGLRIAEDNPDAIILDVRRNDEYKSGHIPGARLLTMETISAESAAKVLPNKNQLILIYCRSGRRSKIAAQSLLDLGYTNLIEFGGILDYKGKLEK
jgi:rhodanese-related sulfurtransferase